MLTKPKSHGPEFLFDGDSMKTVRRRIYQYAHLSSFQKLAAGERKIKIQFTCFLDLGKLACQLFQEKKNRSSQHTGSQSGKREKTGGRSNLKLDADRPQQQQQQRASGSYNDSNDRNARRLFSQKYIECLLALYNEDNNGKGIIGPHKKEPKHSTKVQSTPKNNRYFQLISLHVWLIGL